VHRRRPRRQHRGPLLTMATTVYETFVATAETAPDHAFLAVPPATGRAYHPDGVELTYARTRAEVARMRELYAAAGYGHGHRVALLLENRPEFFFYYLNAGAWYRDLGGRVGFERGRDRILNPLPLFHMNCQAVTATCVILTANCLILPERFSPTRWWRDVVATRATVIHYLGVMPP